MHTRDYSEDTSRVVDEEIARILRDQEERARRILEEHRAGLEAVAAALLERESIDGAEVARLTDEAYGRPIHDPAGVAHVVGGMSGPPPLPVPAAAGAGGGDGTDPAASQPTGNAARAVRPGEPRATRE